jgi:hypothetical protein
MSHMQTLSDPLHFSNLRHMARSPAHYRASILEPRDPTAAMRFGRVVHAVLLGQPYKVWEGTRRGKDWERFEAAAGPDALIVTIDEYDRAMRCCDAVGANALATPLLVGGHEIEWTWTTLGRKCAGRIDVLGDPFITEFKTASSTEPMQFIRGALRLCYHAQLAWYIDATQSIANVAHIVAVEVAPPYCVQVFTLSPRAIEAGRKLYRLWLERLLVCEAANEWPGYCQSIVPFDVPDESAPLIIDGEEVEAA